MAKRLFENVNETANVLAFRHTRPSYPVHIVVIPKRHIASLIALTAEDDDLLLELLEVIREIAAEVVIERGACRVITNMGEYQEFEASALARRFRGSVARYTEPKDLTQRRKAEKKDAKESLKKGYGSAMPLRDARLMYM